MPMVSSVTMQLYNIAVFGCIFSMLIIAMFPQCISIAMAIKKRKSFIIMAKNNGEIELVTASHQDNLWRADSDKKGMDLGIFESKPEDVRRFLNRPTMIAYETVTPSANMKACVLIRHLKTRYGISTYAEYEMFKSRYLNLLDSMRKEMNVEGINDITKTSVYEKLSDLEKATFMHFNALWTGGYFPDVIEPIRLQDMEKFLKYYHDPKAYVVRERNAVSVARAQALQPKEFNLTKWILIGGIVVIAFLMFGGGDSSSAESAYNVANPLSSFLGQ